MRTTRGDGGIPAPSAKPGPPSSLMAGSQTSGRVAVPLFRLPTAGAAVALKSEKSARGALTMLLPLDVVELAGALPSSLAITTLAQNRVHPAATRRAVLPTAQAKSINRLRLLEHPVLVVGSARPKSCFDQPSVTKPFADGFEPLTPGRALTESSDFAESQSISR